MNKENIKSFENYIQEVKSTYGAQGLIVGIFDQENLLYEHVVGYRDMENKKKIDRETIFGIASITKSFTTIGLLQLVSKGIIDLDAPISAYYSDWKLSKENTPTIRQLLSHSGGFFPQERFLMNDFAQRFEIQDYLATNETLAKRGIEAIIDRLNQSSSFNGAPGTYMSYSNFSFGLITDLVRRFSSSSSYAEAIMENVIEPLNLQKTFFDFDRTKNEENITKLYTVTSNGIECTSDYTDLGFVLLGGGALKSTFNDMMTYTRMFMSDGKTSTSELLESSLIEDMTTKQIAYSDYLGYGLGLMVGNLDTFNYIGHSGGLTGVSSFFGYSKDINKGVVVLCNTGAVPASSIGIAALRLANDEYPDYRARQYETGQWSENTIQNTLGVYESQEGDKVVIESYEDGVQAIIGDEIFPCILIHDDLMLIQNKMEENHCRILRDSYSKAWAIYKGLRIIPRKA